MKYPYITLNALIRNCLKAVIPLGALAYAGPVQAKIVKYCVIAKTADETDAGTTGYPKIAMSGEVSPGKRVYSGWKEIGGDQDRDSTDKREFDLEDMGTVSVIDINNSSSNAWKVHYVRIYRNTGCNNTGAADGYSEFSINSWIEDQTKSGYKPSHSTNPRVTVSKDGRVTIKSEEITVANYASVTGQREQMVMQFKESWSNVDAITMSTSSTENLNASATLTYESPETVYGKFGASATAGWSNETSEAREESNEKIQSSEYDWSFVAPGNTFVIKKATFEIPYAHQLYRSSHDGKAYAIRTVGAQIIPSGDVGSFIEIPRRNDDGSITSIGLSELEQNWFPYLKPKDVTNIKRTHLNNWLSQGYVVSGRGGTVLGGGNTPTPTPTPHTPPASASCASLVQGKVAWSQAGNKTWNNDNVASLCAGAVDASARIGCFERGIADHNNWSKAIADCKVNDFAPTSGGSGAINWTQQNVTGRNLSSAHFNGGRFEETGKGTGVWHEYGTSGPARFNFKETHRDDWSVYMTDSSRNVKIQLDVHRKMIRYGDANTAMRDQYATTSLSRIQ